MEGGIPERRSPWNANDPTRSPPCATRAHAALCTACPTRSRTRAAYVKLLERRGKRGIEFYWPGRAPDASDLLPSVDELLEAWGEPGEWTGADPLTGEPRTYTFPETLRRLAEGVVLDDNRPSQGPSHGDETVERCVPRAEGDRPTVSGVSSEGETDETPCGTEESGDRLTVSPEMEEDRSDLGGAGA